LENLNFLNTKSVTSLSFAILVASFLTITKIAYANVEKLKKWEGGPPQSLEVVNLSGEAMDVSANRGNVILVNFWASWCTPCVKEIPSLIRLSNFFIDEPFKIMMINFGETEKKVRSFSKNLSLDNTVFLDSEMNSEDFWVTKGLPVSYILDKNGNITHSAIGEVEWDSMEIKNLIKIILGS